MPSWLLRLASLKQILTLQKGNKLRFYGEMEWTQRHGHPAHHQCTHELPATLRKAYSMIPHSVTSPAMRRGLTQAFCISTT